MSLRGQAYTLATNNEVSYLCKEDPPDKVDSKNTKLNLVGVDDQIPG